MNDLSTTTSALEGVNDNQLEFLIIKNGEQMLEYYVEWRRRDKSDQDFGDLLGISVKTVKNRYLATARKQGLIEASKHSNDAAERTARNRALPISARSRAKPVENSTTTNHLSPQKDDCPEISILQPSESEGAVATVEVLEPLQIHRSDSDIRSFFPDCEKLLLAIEHARKQSLNSAEDWGRLESRLHTLWSHANCERRQREAAEQY